MFVRARSLVLVAVLAISGQSQSATPVATYEIHSKILESSGAEPFQWALAPDNSLLIALGQKDGQWVLRRLTRWDTPTPKEEVLPVAMVVPVGKEEVYLRDLTVDPGGKYLVLRVAIFHPAPKGPQRTEAVVAIVDLHTFTLAYQVRTYDAIAGGVLHFAADGMLIQDHSDAYGSQFGYHVNAVGLPGLDPLASCDYNMKYGPVSPVTNRNPARTITGVSESCAALLTLTHASTVADLVIDRPSDTGFQGLAGPDCDREQLSKAKNLALYRCGKEHFASGGDGGLIIWHDLRVLSIPKGTEMLSVRIPKFEGFFSLRTSAMFAETGGEDYLITRHALRLKIYLIPKPLG
jgi:hypothetical protein